MVVQLLKQLTNKHKFQELNPNTTDMRLKGEKKLFKKMFQQWWAIGRTFNFKKNKYKGLNPATIGPMRRWLKKLFYRWPTVFAKLIEQ